MEWLGGWLKEIVFVVLLAGFIDLLLPNRSFERYVRLVVSLLILLTLMSPIVKLLGGDPAQKLHMALLRTTESLDPSKQNGSDTSQILQQGLALRKKQEAELLQRAGVEVGREMKQQIESKTGAQVQRVEVTLAVDNSSKEEGQNAALSAEKPEIRRVEVFMNGAIKSPETSLPADGKELNTEISVPAIKRVDKVNIQIEEQTSHESRTSNNNHPDRTGTTNPAGGQDIETLIMEQLTKDWGISRSMVKIHHTGK